ncbi:MAG: hypothetical protein SX243_03525 [Acidobacteriota bacterium]|nr:hypothetical protein [Acidobacteriota bacterium]
MSEKDLDWLLHELGQLEERGTGQLLPDEMLSAYRLGRLGEDEMRALEARLSQDREGRQKLAQLAGVLERGPSPKVRERVLSAFDEGVGRQPPVVRRVSPAPWFRHRWAASVALAASLLLAVFLVVNGPEPLPPSLDYQVEAYGLAQERSRPEAESVIEALPETTIRLVVTPRELAEQDVEFGLYRLDEDRLLRLTTGAQLRLEVRRGSAVFEGRAGDLVGIEPGEHRIFIAVARPGELPEPQRLEEGQQPLEVLSDNGLHLAYAQRIHLVSHPR